MAATSLLRVASRAVIDWPVAVGTLVLLNWPTGFVGHMVKAPVEAQRAAYGAEAGVFGVIAGFAVTAAFAFAAIDNSLVRELRRAHGDALNATLVGAIASLVLTALAAVVAVFLAPQAAAGWLASVAALLGLIKLVRVSALAWTILEAGNEKARTTPI